MYSVSPFPAVIYPDKTSYSNSGKSILTLTYPHAPEVMDTLLQHVLF